MGVFMQILGLIFSLTLLVVTHEYGHFLFARLFQTRVDKFYVFFNPSFSIFRMKKFNGSWHFKWFAKNDVCTRLKVDENGKPVLNDKGKEQQELIPVEELDDDNWYKYSGTTTWGIGWVPLGGYCSINGMVDETTSASDLPSEPQPYEFRSKPAWQRFFIITGGVLVNFISAIIIYIAVMFTWGETYVPLSNAKYGIQFTETAKNIGFRDGDKIIAADNMTNFKSIGDFRATVLIDGVNSVKVERVEFSDSELDSNTLDSRQIQIEKEIAIPKDFLQQVLAVDKGIFVEYNFPYVIEKVIENSPAEAAGLQTGDSLIAVNNVHYTFYFALLKQLNELKNQEITVHYSRKGEEFQTQVLLKEDGKLGVYPKDPSQFLNTEHIEYNFWESIPRGIFTGVETLTDYVKQFKLIATKEGSKQLGGFVTIGKIFPKEWNWNAVWNITAFLAIILAFMNILPIPGLDGGYTMFILFEMITRKKPSDKFLGYANMAGMTLLLLLVLYATGLDIFRIFGIFGW